MEARNGALRIRWGARTDVGATRRVNQDALLASPPLFLVADGMGGHAAGDVASRLTIDTFSDLLPQSALSVRELVTAARHANDRIRDDVERTPERAGMGTTLSGFSVGLGPRGAYAAVLNVGDSRTYLFHDDELRPLTLDHSVVQEMLDAGDLAPHEADEHPLRHVITRALGGDADLEVDTSALLLKPGDRLLVCSDGLTSVVPQAAIEATMRSSAHPTELVDELIALALESGAPDNVTTIVVEIVDAPEVHDLDSSDGDTIPGARAPVAP